MGNHVLMLMYGKEASNRKQEIDRQHHTIPNQRNQRQALWKNQNFWIFPQCRLLRNPSFLSFIKFYYWTK